MKVFIDCGAYNGDTLVKAMEKFPDVDMFYAFEPYPPNFKALVEKFGSDEKVKPYQQAVGIKDEIRFLFQHREADIELTQLSVGGSLTNKKGNLNIEHRIKVDVVDFAKFIKDNFKKEDYIILKVDIEGYEYDLFDHLIRKGAIDYIDKIYCEWHLRKLDMSERDHNNMIKALRNLGFDLTGFNPHDEFIYD
jgi:FkbM family methyltransferase